MTDKKFQTSQEEIEHWRTKAEEYKLNLEEVKEELEEYTISSRELELELEAQLEQGDSNNKELKAVNNRLNVEVESLRDKLEDLQEISHKEITELQDNLAQVAAFKDELTKYIRELEQTNDDLERAKRATVVSLEDFEGRLNEAIERNAFLESELGEKETLEETVQRLKDEARDLRQELDVQVVTKSSSQTKLQEMASKATPDGAPAKNKITDMTPPTTPKHAPNIKIPNMSGSNTPLTPSARISALNIVGDLLRKVGALENKLASCRNFVKDQPRKPSTGASPISSPRENPALLDQGYKAYPNRGNNFLLEKVGVRPSGH